MNNSKILISGGFCPYNRIEDEFLDNNYDYVFNDFLEISRTTDITVTNLECPLTNFDTPIKKTGPNIKTTPECIEGIKYADFNLLTLANNHIMDFAEKGLLDTINILDKNGIDYIGAGKNLQEAKEILYKEVNSSVISFINICESEWSIASPNSPGANPLDIVDTYYKIHEAKQNSDFLILIIHGGHENYKYPSKRMIKTYRFFADCGADIIVGHHTHTASGYEIYNETPIFYSLGNFIFDMDDKNNDWYKSFFITFEINNEYSIENLNLHPYYQCRNEPKLDLIREDEKDIFINRINKISESIHDPETINNEFNSLCNEKEIGYITNILSLNRIQRQFIKNKNLNNIIINKNNIRKILNIIRCESHRDCLINILEKLLEE